MARPRKTPEMLEACRELAGLIDAALREGQRPTSSQRSRHWTNATFARAINVGSFSTVADWRNVRNPTCPNDIEPIIKAFYGGEEKFEPKERDMRRAWRRASGRDAEPPIPQIHSISTKLFSDVAEIVALMVNRPTPDNQGNLRLPYTLRFRADENREILIEADGQPTVVSMTIGLLRPMLAITSKHWKPVQDTIFRKKKHPNATPGPVGDSVFLIGPVDEKGRVVGEPLEDEPHLLLERVTADSTGPIRLAVLAARDGFSVTLSSGGAELSATQKDVMDAIFAEAIPRDKRNRLELETANVTPIAQPTPT